MFHDVWVQAGALDTRERARRKAKAILAAPPRCYIPDEIDREIRARFGIRLERNA